MKLIRSILLLALTLLVFVSSTGISVGMHLCGGELSEISLFGATEDCPMEQQKETLPPCHQVPAADMPLDCCDDHTFVLENQDMASDTKAQLLTNLLDVKFFAGAVQVILLQAYGLNDGFKPAYALYASPPIARDIPVLVQSFLI